MSSLWHYTCRHTYALLGDGGTLLPPLWQIGEVPSGLPRDAIALLGLVWATPDEVPETYALGLTNATISCDRTAYRYAVPRSSFVRWGRIRSRLSPGLVEALETARGAEPARWWVAEGPVDEARLDHTYREDTR